ncbi:hypothetical protein Tco_1025396 [Tanacetum coccineum]
MVKKAAADLVGGNRSSKRQHFLGAGGTEGLKILLCLFDESFDIVLADIHPYICVVRELRHVQAKGAQALPFGQRCVDVVTVTKDHTRKECIKQRVVPGKALAKQVAGVGPLSGKDPRVIVSADASILPRSVFVREGATGAALKILTITSIKCVLTQEHLDAICAKYFVPEEVHPQLPSPDATMHERPAGKVGMYT